MVLVQDPCGRAHRVGVGASVRVASCGGNEVCEKGKQLCTSVFVPERPVDASPLGRSRGGRVRRCAAVGLRAPHIEALVLEGGGCFPRAHRRGRQVRFLPLPLAGAAPLHGRWVRLQRRAKTCWPFTWTLGAAAASRPKGISNGQQEADSVSTRSWALASLKPAGLRHYNGQCPSLHRMTSLAVQVGGASQPQLCSSAAASRVYETLLSKAEARRRGGIMGCGVDAVLAPLAVRCFRKIFRSRAAVL